MEMPYQIRNAYRDEWEDAMSLAWRTFLRFEADVYSPEGVRNFENFITDSTLYRMFVVGSYQMFVALDGKKIVGMITLRDTTHISLLFVDEKYHRQGIGRALMQYLSNYLLTEVQASRVTVILLLTGLNFITNWDFGICAHRRRGTVLSIRRWNLCCDGSGDGRSIWNILIVKIFIC